MESELDSYLLNSTLLGSRWALGDHHANSASWDGSHDVFQEKMGEDVVELNITFVGGRFSAGFSSRGRGLC